MRKIWTSFTVVLAAVAMANGQEQRRATITGGGGEHGKCTIEVVVDGASDVEIRGEVATLRNLNGQMPRFRRFQCNRPMPLDPPNFRFEGIDGRGRQTLIRDPSRGGVAVVRIEDPQGGSEGYTFDLIWGGNDRRDDRGGEDRRGGDDRRGGYDERNKRFTTEQAIRVCQDAVREQAAERYRARDIDFRRTTIDDNPGRNDWVIGTFDVRRGYGRVESYRFSCSVNFDTGRVRSADIQPLRR